ncbi:MAG TPA: nuclear transport factor 2 family protein [Chloroflexota bacterium]|nr:nuclear transport factor 2 family protein [Chloroflexota bacterium]
MNGRGECPEAARAETEAHDRGGLITRLLRARPSHLLIGILATLCYLYLPVSVIRVPTAAAQEDPATVLQRFIDARNRGDIAATLALVTDDVRFVGGPQCTPVAPCVGPDALRAEVQSYIGSRVQATIMGNPQVSDMTVQARVEASADPFRAAGVDRIVNNVTVVMRDGKVASFTGVPDAGDPQTARWLALQGVQQAQAGQPEQTALPLRLPRTGERGTAARDLPWMASTLAAGGTVLGLLLLLPMARKIKRAEQPR